MSEPFLGEIKLWPINFEPKGWAFCAGQILSIAQNTALFALLGTTYGGDGQTTFALPDLRSRFPRGVGQGPGLSDVSLGEESGTEAHTLLMQNLPAGLATPASTSEATESSPAGHVPAVAVDPNRNPLALYAPAAAANTTLAAPGGASSQPVPHLPPHLGIHYIIALEGIFPSRS